MSNVLRILYSYQMQLRNLGGLTLIDTNFFSFGELLMKRIRQCVNKTTIEKERNDLYCNAEMKIRNDSELFQLFTSVHKGKEGLISIEEKLMRDVYDDVTKIPVWGDLKNSKRKRCRRN